MVSLAIAFLMGADVAPIKLTKEYSKQELPFERINGISISGSKWVVGSMRGLYVGAPGTIWKKVSDQSIRQVVTVKNDAWALYGNGSVDKLDVKSDRLYYDVLQGAVKRPWVGSLSQIGETIFFGGSGGWFEKDGEKSLSETYPLELSNKHVTCLSKTSGEKFMGTQDGLFVATGSKIRRIGFGDGLSDVWITSLVRAGEDVLVGTYSGGLFLYSNHKVTAVQGPSQKIRCLTTWRNQPVVGGLDGSWIRNGKNWQPLTKGETTFVSVVGNQLAVGTPDSVTFFK